MQWTKTNYPSAMKNLPAEIREKAIHIANYSIEKDHLPEAVAIEIAIRTATEVTFYRSQDPSQATREGRRKKSSSSILFWSEG